MTSTRDKEGYPLDGSVDVVSRRSHLREPLASVMQLLQDANERCHTLLTTVSQLRKDNEMLRSDLVALKYANLCAACQMQRLSTRDGEVTFPCKRCRDKTKALTTLRDEAEDQARYWQRCYESLLAVHYGEGNDDGTRDGLQ